MDLDGLARHVGVELFDRACRDAAATAPGTGTRPEVDPDRPEADVPHELADLVEGDLILAMALYRVMPCHGNLMYVDHWAPRSELFAELRTLLDDPDDALADPAAYWLWCGPFEEDDTTASQAWHAMTMELTERRTGRLLGASGPVPWHAKAPLLDGLATDPRWHDALHEALTAAATDYFGRTDAAAADALRRRLRPRTR